MEFPNIILGLILLVFGRKLFWLFVSIAGFLFGMESAGMFFPAQPPWILFLFALGAGFFGAVLAVLFQGVAFALAGFYGGFYLASIMAQFFGFGGDNIVLFAVVGVIGAIIAIRIMDRIIIVLSCLLGAGAVVASLRLGQEMRLVLFLLLAAAGAIVQVKLLISSKQEEK